MFDSCFLSFTFHFMTIFVFERPVFGLNIYITSSSKLKKFKYKKKQKKNQLNGTEKIAM